VDEVQDFLLHFGIGRRRAEQRHDVIALFDLANGGVTLFVFERLVERLGRLLVAVFQIVVGVNQQIRRQPGLDVAGRRRLASRTHP
jgi:hypothetical protein